jgi:hypothetical protein
MVKSNGAYSKEHVMEKLLYEGVQAFEGGRIKDSRAVPEREDLAESERSEDDFEGGDDLSQSALMNCYNG